MKAQSYTFEFVTPCFCGGAEPTKAELRAPAIRGQLRWWFRVLVNNRSQEEAIFGGAGSCSSASKIVVRIKQHPNGGELAWNKQPLSQNDGNYLWYFIKQSDRWTDGGALPPGSKAEVEIGFRQPLGELEEKWEKAWEAFCRFGSLGYRATRCGGAFRVNGFAGGIEAYKEAAERILQPARFHFHFCPDKKGQLEKRSDWRSLVKFAEERLKQDLRKRYSARKPSPLGNATPRQTSAVYLRPLKIGERDYYLMLFEAPHDRVVGKQSRLPNPHESILETVFS